MATEKIKLHSYKLAVDQIYTGSQNQLQNRTVALYC